LSAIVVSPLWEQVAEHRAQRHRVNREQLITGQFDHDHFEEVPGSVRPDCEDLRRIRLGVEIDDDNRMVGGVSASRIPCRLADRWISTREYRNTYFCSRGTGRPSSVGATTPELGPLPLLAEAAYL
jgi:hypothetical protein